MELQSFTREKTSGGKHDLLDAVSLGLSSMPSAFNLDSEEFIWLDLVSNSQGRNEFSSKFRKPREPTWPYLVSDPQGRDALSLRIKALDSLGLSE